MKNIVQRLNPISVSLAIFLFLCINIVAQEEKTETINLIISTDILSGVNRTDAKASIEGVMSEVLGKHHYAAERILPEIVNSIEEIKNMLKQNNADLIGISSLNYLELRNELAISPIFTIQRNSTPGVSYVLLVQKNSKIKSLADLKSKKILTLDTYDKEIVDKWMFVEMKKEQIINPTEIIESFAKTPKSSKRMFSVFFKNADGCFLSKEKFESACELNPQLSKKLKILYESPQFLTQVFCANDYSKKKGLSETKNFISNLNKDENGSKMLKLFKAVTITSFREEYIRTIEKLFDDYNRYLK